MFASEIFLDRLSVARLTVMRRDLGHDHRFSKLSLLFTCIPIDGSQGGLKICSTEGGCDEVRIPDRRKSLHYMISVPEVERDELRIFFFHINRDDDTSQRWPSA